MVRLRELRKEKGLTQKELAAVLKVSDSTLSYWEQGKFEPDNFLLKEIAKYFNVSVEYLLGKTNFKNTAELFESFNNLGYFEAAFDFGELIKAERENQGVSIEEMSSAMGLTISDLDDIESGILPLNYDWAEKLAQYLNTDVSQILFDNELYDDEVPEKYHKKVREWERLKEKADNDARKEAGRRLPDNIIPLPETKVVPLLGDIACGSPLLAEENIEMYIKMDKNIPADYALRCKGDSMINARIFDGDIVFIRKQSDVDNGEIAAVLIDNEATLKKVYKIPEKNRVVLSPCNPMYDDQVYTEEQLEDVRIIGKAVAFISTVR